MNKCKFIAPQQRIDSAMPNTNVVHESNLDWSYRIMK